LESSAAVIVDLKFTFARGEIQKGVARTG